jgi:cytochrome c5
VTKAWLGLAVCVAGLPAAAAPLRADERGTLQPPSAFAAIADPRARSAALFTEAGKVIADPRCVNCHPAGDRPHQGDDARAHFPLALRGPDGDGVPGAPCSTCHGAANARILVEPETGIPGHPRWQLAPKEMAWEGKTLGEICAQLKDPARNGGRTLALLHEHMAHDDLVAWGWNPGAGRRPVAGTQQQFGALIQAWIDTGAVCPG